MGLKIHPGSFGVTGVKKVIFTKNATSPTNYRVWSCDSCTYISLTPSTKVMGLKIHPGSFGVTGVKRSFSLKTLLLLQFTGYGHVTHVHASAWPPLYKSYGSKNSPGVIWGHRGQKVIFTKNATSPTDYRVRSRDSCTYIRLTPSTNVMGLKIHTGSFGVTGVKRSFSPKMLLLLEITWHGHIIHAYESARYPVSKLWV